MPAASVHPSSAAPAVLRPRHRGRRGRVALAFAALALAACDAAARADEARQEAGGGGRFLSFLDAPASGQPLASVPTLLLSFGGGAGRAVMDTGSTGVVVSASRIPDWESLPSAGPAELTYSSSGRVMRGRWVVAPVTVTGGNGASVTTVPMPVMAVTGIDCLPRARDCVPEAMPSHVAMLGVGFARQGDHQAQSTPDRNPFLRVAPGGASRRGYVVTHGGVQVGLGAEEDPGFVTVPLSRSERFDDWAPPPACIGVAGHAPACGTVLVDTGIPGAFLTVPPDRLAGVSDPRGDGEPGLLPGTRVEVRLGRVAGADWGYAFTVGDDTSPVAPRGVTLVRPGERPTFLNTGFHVLNEFDYLYDADGGLVGYRPRPLRP